MALETAPASQASTGNWRITYIPSGNALSVAILNGGTAKPLTYSFTPDGFNRTITEVIRAALTRYVKRSKPDPDVADRLANGAYGR